MTLARRITVAVIALGVVALVIIGFMPKPVPVETAIVTRGLLQETISEEGKTRVIDRFVISAPVAAYARRIDLNVGDRVSSGALLVELEPLRSDVMDPRARAEAQARVARAEAAARAAEEGVRAAEAAAELAASVLARNQELQTRGHASQDELDRARADDRRRKAELSSARFNVDVAGFDLRVTEAALEHSAAIDSGKPAEKVALRSPVSGSVLRVYRESEGVVAAGTPLVELGNSSNLEVEVDVLSQDAVQLRAGLRVLLERWGGETPLEARVRVVEPTGFTKVSALGVEEQRVLVIADIASPTGDWERLGDGYRVEARFILWEGNDVLQVPASALFHVEKNWAVFVVEGDHVTVRTVQTGHASGLATEITGGLQEGDEVVVHPEDTLADGARVERR